MGCLIRYEQHNVEYRDIGDYSSADYGAYLGRGIFLGRKSYPEEISIFYHLLKNAFR